MNRSLVLRGSLAVVVGVEIQQPENSLPLLVL